jgi:hypothetical protein
MQSKKILKCCLRKKIYCGGKGQKLNGCGVEVRILNSFSVQMLAENQTPFIP